MFSINRTGQFKKDYKRILKRNYDINLLAEVLSLLSTGEALPLKYYEHKLKGKYSDTIECHILPDWLLIFQRDIVNKEILLIRTGTHSDLFKK